MEHPRALFVFRVVLYVTVATVLGAMGVVLVVSLGFVAVVGGLVALLSAEVTAVALLAVGGVLTLCTSVVALGVVVSARRVDAQVTASDRRPDPIVVLQTDYVNGELDEFEFERRLERLLDARRRGREAAVPIYAEKRRELA